jgi:hypothetical protein
MLTRPKSVSNSCNNPAIKSIRQEEKNPDENLDKNPGKHLDKNPVRNPDKTPGFEPDSGPSEYPVVPETLKRKKKKSEMKDEEGKCK